MRRRRRPAVFARVMFREAWIGRAQVESIFHVQSKCWFRARGIEQRRPASCSSGSCGGLRRLPNPSEFVIPYVVWIIVAIEFDAFAAIDVGVHRSLMLPLSVDLLSFPVFKQIYEFTALDLRAATAGTLFVMLT